MEQLIVETLEKYNVKATIVKKTEGPSTILVELKVASKVKDIISLEDELSMALHAQVRITPMYTNGTVGIEIPKETKEVVVYEDIATDHILSVYLGISPDGQKKTFDLTKTPHLLVAGATGQGKSVFLNCLLTSIIPANVKLLLIDPKKVEFSQYANLNVDKFFNNTLPITDNSLAIEALKKLCEEMDARYEVLKHSTCRNILEYNSKGHNMPYIVCVIDEYADLVMFDKNVETYVQRIAQLARAVGIHIVIATQRPSTQVITGSIKANLPTKIAFKVGSNTDSRVVLDQGGAEKLTGSGDMLYSSGIDTLRIQGCYVTNDQIQNVIDKCNTDTFLSKLQEASKGDSSVSEIQRKMKLFGQSGFDKITEGLNILKASK